MVDESLLLAPGAAHTPPPGSIALLGRVAATACSLFVRGSRRSSAKEGEESYRKERERGLPACVSPVTPPTRDTCRIFSCANITCSVLANIMSKPERAGDEPISRYSKLLENLLRVRPALVRAARWRVTILVTMSSSWRC